MHPPRSEREIVAPELVLLVPRFLSIEITSGLPWEIMDTALNEIIIRLIEHIYSTA